MVIGDPDPRSPSAASTLETIPSPMLKVLAAVSDRRLLRGGEILIRAGEPSNSFFIVLSGRFAVYGTRSTEPVAEIAQGEVVGEIGFFAGLPRTATVGAVRDSIVLDVDRSQFEIAVERLPSIREWVAAFLAGRLEKRVAGSVAPSR